MNVGEAAAAAGDLEDALAASGHERDVLTRSAKSEGVFLKIPTTPAVQLSGGGVEGDWEVEVVGTDPVSFGALADAVTFAVQAIGR
jgi:hypothetical protein